MKKGKSDARRVSASGTQPGRIEHVVVLMLENRSFDHIFGFRQNVNGLKGSEFNPLNPALPVISADVFKEMDGGFQLTDEEIEARNTRILWTAGNQVFWDLSVRMEFSAQTGDALWRGVSEMLRLPFPEVKRWTRISSSF